DQVEPHLRRERLRGGVQLLRRQRGEAPLVVGDRLHSAFSSSACCSSANSISPSACSPWTIPAAPSRPCVLTRSYSARDSFTSFATCGGNGGGTLPFRARPMANFVCLIAATIPCVLGTSSVSRSQPVVLAEWTNHLACFAPMSRSIPCF